MKSRGVSTRRLKGFFNRGGSHKRDKHSEKLGIETLEMRTMLSIGPPVASLAEQMYADHSSAAIATPSLFALEKPVSGQLALQTMGARLSSIADAHQMTAETLADRFANDSALYLTSTGGLYYADPAPDLSEILVSQSGDVTAANAPFPLDQTFQLHSNPNSTKIIYLDFDGHITPAGSGWNDGLPIYSTPYDFDGTPGAFSDAEREVIQGIWARVAEDFAPFDVDVTTELTSEAQITRSGSGDQEYGMRCVISPTSDWCPGPGGIAYIGVFGSTSDATKPCFVFSNALGNDEKNIAEASSHEVGHTVGLLHDGSPAGGYYGGHGSGETGWAPIMGVGYSQNVVQWSKGEYANANNHEDDLTIIAGPANGFGYRPDDAGNTFMTSSLLTSTNYYGIVETTDDVDMYRFASFGDPITIDIDPYVISPNLDILAKVYDSAGTLLALSNPLASLSASFSLDLPEGLYYLTVEGTGCGSPFGYPPTGYTEYASLGQYWITGSFPVVSSGPDLAVFASHDGTFLTGKTDNTYNINVMNVGGLPTSGIVSVADILPDGLTATAMSGDGWTIDFANLSASRMDPLPAGMSYPPITITVDVDAGAPESVVNEVYLTRYGEMNLVNNEAFDVTSLRVFQISQTSPDFATGIVNAGTGKIDLHFNSMTVGANDRSKYHLSTPGADGLLGTLDDEAVTFDFSFVEFDADDPLNPAKWNNATLSFLPLTENLYRLTVDDSITDTAGKPLDGDGDNQPGEDYLVDFVVVPSTELLSTPLTYSSGGHFPTKMAVGDFNGDGKKDLAVLNSPFDGQAPSVQILLGNGKGAFAAGVSLTANLSSPSDLAVGDFNGDHKDDLAVSNYGNNTVNIYRGNNAGGFTQTSTVGVGTRPIDLAVGDFNGDGKTDIAVANSGNPTVTPAVPGALGIITTSGSQFNYQSIGVGSNLEPRALAVADFTGDNKLDLALTNYGSNNVVLYQGNGAGGFAVKTTKATGSGFNGPRDVATGDFNGDGKTDLAVVNYLSNNVAVFLGNGAGGLSNATLFYTGTDVTPPIETTNPRGVAVADFNSDGKADIIITNGATNNVAVLLGNGSGGFAAPQAFTTGTSSGVYGIVVADLNGDKRPDVAVTDTGTTASNDSVTILYDFYGVPSVNLYSPNGYPFDISIGGFGQGQLIQGTNNAFDGYGRLSVGGTAFQPATTAYTLADGDQTLITGSVTAAGLAVTRRITVPNTGNDDFARTTDVFTNPTNTAITTVVQVTSNLGSDGTTSVFATSSGDTTLSPGDLWFATQGAKSQTLLHYLHGYAGLAPSSVKLLGDNLVWTYELTVPALSTRELAYFTVLLDDANKTQAAAEQKANALVSPTGFVATSQAALGLNATDLSQLANFVFSSSAQSMTVNPSDWSKTENGRLTVKKTADGLVHVYETGTEDDVVPPQLYSSISGLIITGRNDVEDELTVDLTGGNPAPAGGLTFNGGGGGGNTLLIAATSADDSAALTSTQFSNNGVTLVNYTNAAHFAFGLGGGADTLFLDNVTCSLDRDNAFSAGTNVTVNGGSLDFNGHATAIGNLVLKNNAQVNATGIENIYTTVISGTLNAGSIVADTLTIGGGMPVPSPDRYEDNDNKAIVDARPEGAADSPNLGPIGITGMAIAGLTMEDAADWYRFNMDSEGTAGDLVRIDFSNALGNLDLAVYKLDGTTLVGSSAGVGNSEVVSLSGMPAGSYYVKVTGYQGATNPNYSLTILPILSDAYEDNDSKAIVDALPEGAANSSNLGPIGPSGLAISDLTMDDAADWYRFRMDSVGTAADVLRIDFSNAQGNLDLVVYRADGTTVVGTSAGTGDSEIVNLNGQTAGYYYAKVSGATSRNYNLSIAPIASDVYEENDARAIVDILPEGGPNSSNLGLVNSKRVLSGLTMNDWADWYKFRLGAAGTQSDFVQIDFVNGHGNLDLEVYGADGETVVGTSAGTGNSEAVSLSGLPAGYYYVKVYGYQAATNPGYELTFFPLSPDAYEDNDTKAIVDALPEGGTNSSNLGTVFVQTIIDGLTLEDAADWYKFQLGSEGTATNYVKIDFAHAEGDLDMILYGADGETIVGASYGKGDGEFIGLNTLPAGTYYVKVYGYLGAKSPEYALTIMPISPDWLEEDDSVNTATDLGSVGYTSTYTGLTMEDDADWFKFTLDVSGTRLDYMQINFLNSLGNLDMSVYAADGTTLVRASDGIDDGEVVNLEGLLAGDYYVKVYGNLGAMNPDYTFIASPVRPDRYEDNDSAAIVDGRPEGETDSPNLGYVDSELLIDDLTLEDDADWYSFYFGGWGIATDYVAIKSDSYNLTLEVFEADGTTPVGSADYVGDWLAVSMEEVPNGNYYVKVSAAPGDTNPNYTLGIMPILPDSYEFDGQDLGKLGEKLEITDLTMEDAGDWFRFEMLDVGRKDLDKGIEDYIEINSYFGGDLDVLLIKIVDPNIPTILTVNADHNPGSYGKIPLVGVPAGVYYIKVYDSSIFEKNPNYTLTIYPPPPPPAAAAAAASPAIAEAALPALAASELAASFVPSFATPASLNAPSNAVAPKLSAALGGLNFAASESVVSTDFWSDLKLDFAANRQTLAVDAVFGDSAAPSATDSPIARGNFLVEQPAKAAAAKIDLSGRENWDLTLRQIAGRNAAERRAGASLRQELDAAFEDLDIAGAIL
jgi:hypothetical protein